MVQWLRIHLPMQPTQVWSLVQEDPICQRATKPVHPTIEPSCLEPVPQQEKPPHEKSTHHN